MKEKIDVRQICFIMLAYTAVSKLIIYPTQLSFTSGRDLLWSAALNLLVEGVVIWSLAYLCSRTDCTFFELLANNFGEAIARIVYGLFALFFIANTVVPLFEQRAYVHAIFYDTVPALAIFLPIFFFTVYAGAKDFINIGRCADICLPLFALSMLFILTMSLQEVKWDNFLPVLTQPIRPLKSSLSNAFRFGEPAFLLMFMGRFKYKSGDAAKITLSFAGGAAVVIAVLAIFYGIYGDIAASRLFAISKISLFFPAIDLLGRIDLFALYVLEITMLFALVLNIQLAVHGASYCTGYNNREVLSLAVNAVLFAILVAFKNSFGAIGKIWSQWMWIAVALFAYAVPLLLWTLRKKND